jgi:3-oxoacyl-[acyl-carrier protein] reductase
MGAAPTEPGLEGKAAVVTGASHGIGRAVALALAGHGVRVVANASGSGPDGPGSDPEPLDRVVEEIRAEGGTALASLGSVAEPAPARELIATCIRCYGAIDILVNCAGIGEGPAGSILDIPPERWDALIAVHLSGTFHTCRQAAPAMVERGRGAIVNTASHAFLGIFGGTGYPAGKGGTVSLTRAIAAELRDRGVTCNAVCPGARTRLSSGAAYEEHVRDLSRRGILDELHLRGALSPPAPEGAAPIYAFLASDRARHVTGRLFSAAGSYVGLFAEPVETLVALEPSGGVWELEALSDAILARLGEPA